MTDPFGDDPAPRPPRVPRESTPKAPRADRPAGGRRLIVILAAGLATAGLVAGSVVAGWAAANRLVVSTQSGDHTELVTVALPAYDPDSSARMPDVRGLSADDAAQVIADAGIPVGLVSFVERPAAGPVGVVVQQTPVFGTGNPATIELVLSQAATIPDAVGADAVATVSRLQALGARVTQVRAYVPGAVVGTVAALDPAPGAPVPEAVTVTVADSPSRLPLTDLDPASGSAGETSDVLAGGVLYDTAVTLSGSTTGRTTAWALGGNAASVEGTLGVSDDADADTLLLVVVSADGREIARYTARPGAPQPFVWSVAGVSTLTVLVVDETRSGDALALFDAELLGSFDQLQALR